MVNRHLTVLAGVCAGIILLLNVVLLYQTFGGTLPL
jgi:Mn2+/Fe2+ NRAMP family transporter